MEQTPKYGLKKPGGSDYADVSVLNENADTLEQALDGLEQGKADLNARLTSHAGKTDNPHKVTAAQVGARPSTWTPTKADVGLGNVPNVATNDQTPTFTQAETRASLVSGERLSSLFGKLMKWLADLKTVAFTGAYSDLSGRPANMTPTAHAASHRSGGSDPLTAADVGADAAGAAGVVDGKLTTHAGNKSNPHGVTAVQIGARPSTWTPTAADVGAVPTARKINSKPLTSDITLTAGDIGAAAASHGTHVTYSTAAPVVDGTATVGTASTVARSDHRHPTDTSRASASHTHTKSQITDFPATMPPTSHTHSAADITSGTLTASRGGTGYTTLQSTRSAMGLGNTTGAVPVANGGTGATTAAAARTALAALGAFAPKSITISTTWTGSGPWTQNITVSGVQSTWDWRLGLHLAKITDDAARKLQEAAFGCITWCETYSGGITLTCRDKKPDVAISAILAGEV